MPSAPIANTALDTVASSPRAVSGRAEAICTADTSKPLAMAPDEVADSHRACADEPELIHAQDDDWFVFPDPVAGVLSDSPIIPEAGNQRVEGESGFFLPSLLIQHR